MSKGFLRLRAELNSMKNKNLSTGREVQRTDFVESLYNGLRKKTLTALNNHEKLISMATSFLGDGLEPQECEELLMIDAGISREAAQGYVHLARKDEIDEDAVVEGSHEYSFQFEDENGTILSSYDIGRVIKASSEEDAWEKAEGLLQHIEAAELIKVTKIS